MLVTTSLRVMNDGGCKRTGNGIALYDPQTSLFSNLSPNSDLTLLQETMNGYDSTAI
jgi:hypothetical protein